MHCSSGHFECPVPPRRCSSDHFERPVAPQQARRSLFERPVAQLHAQAVISSAQVVIPEKRWLGNIATMQNQMSLILCWCLDQWCLDQLGFSLGPSMEYTLSRIFTHIYAYLMYTYAYLLIFQASIKGAAFGSPHLRRPAPLCGILYGGLKY